MQAFQNALDSFNNFIWGYPMIILLVITHVFLTIKLKFIQRYVFRAIKLSVAKDTGHGMVSNFGAMAVSLAATIGTGSILGVTTSVALGGPGSIFWMIVIGIFGIATKYAECTLAVEYRVRASNGEYVGGPMYIMKNILKKPWLGVTFAVCGLLAGIGGGGVLQVNAMADILGDAYSVNALLVGGLVAILVAFVIIGGVKSVASVCTWLVPFMGGLYLLAAIYIFITHFQEVPQVIMLVLKSAFSFKAAGSGVLGAGIMAAITNGASRSVMSTEAGMGSAAIVSAAAITKNPVHQGLVASTSVFWTIIICSLTGLIILLAGDWQSGSKFAGDLCNSAFNKIPVMGTPVLVISLCIFSFTTIIGWAYYCEKMLEFLGGVKVIKPFRIFWIASMFLGALISSQMAWSIITTATALMAIPNLIMIFMLKNDIVKVTKKYLYNETTEE